MFRHRLAYLGCLLTFLIAGAGASMQCPGSSLSCPNFLFGSDKEFCCYKETLNLDYCCDANEYIKQHPGIVAGIVIGVLLLIALPVACCICCFCACCPIYQRRVQRGTVLYR